MLYIPAQTSPTCSLFRRLCPRSPRVLRIRLAGADAGARAEGVEPQAARSSYFLGDNPSRWLTDVPHYGRVEYHGAYPGIDVAYYGNNQQLEYDFIVAPHADANRIRLAIEGADRIRITQAGELVLTVGSSEIRERKPVIYQETGGGRREIQGRYVRVARNEIGFEIGNFDRSRPLIIDPVLVFATYFGRWRRTRVSASR